MATLNETWNRDYDLGNVLGTGAAGTVYRARRKSDGRLVAMKIVADQHAHPRLWREARVLQSARHRNVVGYITHGVNYLVMDLLQPGVTLQHYWVGGGRMTANTTFDVLMGICDGLSAIHGAGFIHRDLKPGNVFLIPQGLTFLPVILDLGLAKPLIDAEELTDPILIVETGQFETRVLGTPGYMSPEQARGEKISPRSDMYAVGCLLFLLLTGEELITEEGVAGLNRIARGTPEDRLHLVAANEQATTLLCRLLDNDPTKRPSAAEAAQILRALRDELNRPPRPENRDPVGKGGLRIFAAMLAGSLVALLAGVALRMSREGALSHAKPRVRTPQKVYRTPPPEVRVPPRRSPPLNAAAPSPAPSTREIVMNCPPRPPFTEGLRVGHNRVPDQTYWWQCQSAERRARLCTRFRQYGHGDDPLIRERCRLP